MNARKRIETRNAGMKDHLEALSEPKSGLESFSEIHG
jgi:hypothetical protein